MVLLHVDPGEVGPVEELAFLPWCEVFCSSSCTLGGTTWNVNFESSDL